MNRQISHPLRPDHGASSTGKLRPDTEAATASNGASSTPWRISPLARRLVLATVVFGTLVALVTTAIQLYVDYRRELGQIDGTFRQITHSHLPTVTSALWATNRAELQIALDGLERLPDVQYAAVYEGQSLWAETGVQKQNKVQSRDYPLTYQHRGQVERIGTLRVVIDIEGVYARLLDKFWVILITNGVKTLTVSAFMLWLFHWLITRHLRHIADFASRLGFTNLEERLQLSRRRRAEKDEFDLLLDGFGRMQSNLSTTLHMLNDDITQRKLAEEQLKLAASVFEHSHEGIMITDADAHILNVNPSFTRITGYTKLEAVGQNPRMLSANLDDAVWHARMWESLLAEGHWQGERWNRRKNGEVYPEREAISAVYDDDGRVRHYVAVFSDISQQKAHEAELDRIAHHDPLTGLPNRRLLADRLAQAMARSQRDGTILTVACLDLDGFKPINDTFGHAAGDQLLIELSQRLKNTLRGDDTLARLGGDEFVLLLSGQNDIHVSQDSLKRILATVNMPIMLGEQAVQVSASIGVALYPIEEVDGDTLLRHADQAMYAAKQAGKNCYHVFDPQADRELKGHRDQLLRLARALTENEFLFHFQPKVDLLSGDLVGVEALIRWQHPEQGLLYPGAFLDHFNGHSLEIELGEWVIETALRQLESWQDIGLTSRVSVNISANHLLHPDFVTRLSYLLDRHPGLSSDQLELEVLESAAMSDLGRAIEVIGQCKKIGVHFALDDFGTGYSSLAYFRRLPVDTLKIDQSFVRDMLIDVEDLAIVESVVRLAQVFGRATIAEGVETLEHASRLIEMGCTQAQGYGIARPMPADALPAWLEKWRAEAVWRKYSNLPPVRAQLTAPVRLV
ncbi:MAG: EAL domain-containing protein [Thiobacillus sp.]|nr:EAL domain-containing protein [Thiobacillus sp.]